MFFNTIPKSTLILKFAAFVFGLVGVIQGYILSWKIYAATFEIQVLYLRRDNAEQGAAANP